MRRVSVRYVLSVLSVLLLPALAAELNFSADVDRTTAGLDEQIQLTVTVEGTNIGGVPRPQLPALEDFSQLGSTSSQSTSISLINGRMTQQQTISFIYFLSAKRVGDLTIPACKLNFKGTTYQTQPIAVTVTKESQAAPTPSQQRQSPFGFPDRSQPRSSGRANVRLTASADRTSVFQGEQVTVTYVLYTQAQIGDLGIKNMPGFTGFWAEKLFDAKELSWRTTTYDGQRYSAATLKQVALFPTQSGELKIDKMTVSGQAVVSGGFFFDSAEPFEVSSDPITINVKPLPEAGRPPDFNGGVGEFKVTASLSRDSSVGGEPLTLAVGISGTGNLGLVGEPKVGAISGVKILNPETKQNTRTADGRVAGERTFNYPLIPTADGKFVIPEGSMSFFNPKTGSYYTQVTPRLEFVATGATGKTPLADAESGVKMLGTDILHIKPALGRNFVISPFSFFISLSWFFYPAGLVVLALGIVMGRHRRKLEQDKGYARRTRSSRLVKKGLAEATKLLAQGNEREFHAALNRAVIRYVGDRFNIESTGMTGDQLQSELAGRNVDADTVAALLELIASCDAARFSSGMTRCTPQQTLEKARIVLERL
ncbi:MAG: BatD family protein [candidate division WOR-3 bacterium]|nr:BatD family protein [candidate division WOR-3 bacterium]